MPEPLPLAQGFAPASREDWLAEVRRVVLRGRTDATEEEFQQAFARRLVTRTEDGLEIQPLYTAEDRLEGVDAPGFAPFVRSTHVEARPWEVRQRVWPEVEGSSAVEELESGATGVWIDVAGDVDLGRALSGVLLDLAPVSLWSATPSKAVELLQAWDLAGTPADERRGCLGLDPLGSWARAGGVTDLEGDLAASLDLVRQAADGAPEARVFVVDGTVWHDAGATEAQELAWTIAAGMWLVRGLVDRGIPITTACRSVEFRFAATAEQFPTMAKLRAARWLWARALELAGLDEAERGMVMHAECSRVMLSRYDVWVNILRSTVATFAAAVGGADAITVLPHDLLSQPGGSRLGRRIARNTQSILALESHLSKVIDPAGGSWFVETLTEDLAHEAWSLVRTSEESGGVADMLRSGAIEEALTSVRHHRARDIATRRRPITGVSEFPNIEDRAEPVKGEEARVEGVIFPPLTLHRDSQDFEDQRLRAQSMDPSAEIYLATLGTPADFTARATFAKNFFETAGLRTTIGPVEGFASSSSSIACLCSDDARYAEDAVEVATALRDAGASRIYLAGRGLDVPGVDEEIGLGVDVLGSLTRLLDALEESR